MEPAHSQPLPFADAAAGTAAAAAFTVQLPPIRTGFGSPIKDSPVKKMGQSGAKGMASSASFSDWVPARPAARPQLRSRSTQQSAARAAGPSAARGAAMLGVILLVVVLVFAISRAAASTHQHEMQVCRAAQWLQSVGGLTMLLSVNRRGFSKQSSSFRDLKTPIGQHWMQEARLQFRWQAEALPLMLDPNATAPAAGDAVQPWPDSASGGQAMGSHGQARRLLRAALPAMP